MPSIVIEFNTVSTMKVEKTQYPTRRRRVYLEINTVPIQYFVFENNRHLKIITCNNPKIIGPYYEVEKRTK